MLSQETDGQIRALTHLVTLLLHRVKEADEKWCREVLDDLRAQQAACPIGDRSLEKAYDFAISIVERVLKS